MGLSEDILRVRRFVGITRKALSLRTKEMFEDREFHVSAAYLKKLESSDGRDHRVPSDPKARAIASACGVIPDAFLLERLPHRLSPAFTMLAERVCVRPTYELDVRSCWRFVLPASREHLGQRLPPGLIPSGNPPSVEIVFQCMREPRIGWHAECVVYAPVLYLNQPHLFVLDYYVDSWMAVCIAREVYGYPARLGHPRITCDRAELTISGLPLLSLHAPDRRPEEPIIASPEPPTVPSRPHLCHKQILAADGAHFAVDQLVLFTPEIRYHPTECGRKRVRGEVHLHTNLYRMLWGVTDSKVRALYLTNYSVTMPPGRVDRDYGSERA